MRALSQSVLSSERASWLFFYVAVSIEFVGAARRLVFTRKAVAQAVVWSVHV
jgi:hypothetical protein